MIYSKNNSQQTSLTISLSCDDRQTALTFAQQQFTPEKATQVYQNTLAILAVDHYLELLDITTDLKASYSWNKLERIALDTADLKIIERKLGKNGHLECRPLLLGEEKAHVPPDVWNERIAYLFVQLNTDYTQARLLGYLPYVSQDKIFINNLYSLNEFLDYLYQPSIDWVCLRDWLENLFTPAWQELQPTLAFRHKNLQLDKLRYLDFDKDEWVRQKIQELFPSLILPTQLDLVTLLLQIIEATQDEETRWQAAEMLWKIDPHHWATGVRRILDLGMQLGNYPIALMVALLEKLDGTISILIRVYPMEQQTLPPDLKLMVYEQNNQIAEAHSRHQPLDSYIQLKLIANIGERFSVKISLKGSTFQEYFLI